MIKFSAALVATLLSSQVMAQSVDLRGLDTLGGSRSGKAQTTFKEPSYSGTARLDLSNPALADTLSGAGNRVSGLCGAPEKGGATVTNCYGLVGPSTPLPDMLK